MERLRFYYIPRRVQRDGRDVMGNYERYSAQSAHATCTTNCCFPRLYARTSPLRCEGQFDGISLCGQGPDMESLPLFGLLCPLVDQLTHAIHQVWSNFEIADLDFWRGEAYSAYFDYLDRRGGFYYEVGCLEIVAYAPTDPISISVSDGAMLLCTGESTTSCD